MPHDGSGRLFLLLTESFAVRALLGSIAAALLAWLAVRFGLVRSGRARRLLVLAPVLTAAWAAVLSVGEAYLPQLWIATTAVGPAAQLLDLLGEPWSLTPQREIDLLLVAYLSVAAFLLCRRVAGIMAGRRTVRRAAPPIGYGALVPIVHRLAAKMEIRTPRLVLVNQCPGGAFTVGWRRSVVAVDPALADRLDDRELEGLLAHELAHIRRRDNLLGVATGVFRDLTFFLPPVHMAARWLYQEQEESADDVASGHTRRPAALASSILKVWDRSGGYPGTGHVCTAVPTRQLAYAGGGSARPAPLSDSAKMVAHRVQRLIEPAPCLPRWRRTAEVGFAGAVTAAAVGAALAVPTWVVTQYNAEALAFGYLSTPPTAVVDSPAFATFRVLTPEKAAVDGGTRSGRTDALLGVPAEYRPECPCVETRAQLREGVLQGNAAARHRMVWADVEQDAWQLNHLSERASVRESRPLWTLSDAEQQVGFFLVGTTASAH